MSKAKPESGSWFEVTADPAQIAREREKARKLRKTQWWRDRLNRGFCHYCGAKFAADELSMDHIVPLARGGKSTEGNIVPACRDCNAKKKLETPVEALLAGLRKGEPGDGSET